MPILGSSSISNTGNAGGPTGNTGSTGPTGATGNSGITKGATGSTGIYIKTVNSFLNSNQIQFISNDNTINITLFGFTGPTGGVHDTEGVSAALNTNYKTPFYRVDGFTLNFYGLSAGTGINIGSNGDKITVTYQPGNTPYTLYPQADKLAFIQTTSINGGNTGTLGTRIHTSSDNKILNFGLTGVPSGLTFAKLYSNLNEGITYINSVSVTSNGGITLDLTQGYSNYWLTTPIGITAFKGHTFTDIRQEYTLLFDGGYVWNLPKTLFLLNTDIKNYSFLDGLNILHVWSDNGGITYNGRFIERGIGYGTSSILPGGQAKGSCCIPDADGSGGTCNDEITRTACIAAGGVFKALIPCSRRGESICTGGGKSLKSGTEGACCCGNTGCVDATNKPSNILTVDKAFCDVIGGKFYLNQVCGALDKWPDYPGRSSNNLGSGNPIICHSCASPAVACCRPDATNPTGFTCSQETAWYCQNVLSGTPFDSQICNATFCQSQLETGWCRVNGIVTANVERRNCVSCGVFSTSGPPGAETPAPTLTITTPKPLLRIVSSTTNSTVNQTSYSSSTVGASYLGFTINGSGLYKIKGEIEILDTASAITPKKFSIWDPAGCIEVKIKHGGAFIGETSNVGSGAAELTIRGKGCSDFNFNGKLTLSLESCSDGVISGTQKVIDLIHTDSPCTCLAFSNGDVINKKPIVIQFSADRYCVHCTKKELSTDKYFSHIPYPLKRQTGIITICPPTGLSGTSCGMISSFCVTYDPIKELSGCTYSSRFDGNNDDLVLDQVYDGVQEGNTLPANCYHAEYNEPGSGTTYFHKYDPQFALYPEEIEFATTWFNTNPGADSDHPVDAEGNDIPITRLQFNTGDYKKHHIRTCVGDCKKSVMVFPVDCDAAYPDTCDTDGSGLKLPGPSEGTRRKCRTCPGQAGTWFTALEARGLERLFPNPYFNQLFFDEDALKYIANVYGLDPYFIQWKLHRELQKYGSLFDPSKTYMDHITTNISTQSSAEWASLTPEQQQALLIDPLGDVGGSSIDSDDKARQSCNNCSGFFDNFTRIQIPDPDFSAYRYSTYGLVIEKIKQCGVDGGITADSSDSYCGDGGKKSNKATTDMDTLGDCTDEINKYCNKQKQIQKDLKYYLFIVKQNKTVSTDNCILVYDLAQQRILYGGELGNGIFGTAFCRGGDIICPLNCEVPVKIREVAWLGDLNSSNISTTKNCSDSVGLDYTLNDISGSFTAYDDYQYTSITDTSFFQINGGLDRSDEDVSTRLAELGNAASVVFCRTGSTDYLNKKCALCTNTNCYSDIIPELIEFIGVGCSVEGMNCSGVPYIQADYATFIPDPNLQAYDKYYSWVTTATGKSVHWLIESNYNTAIAALRSPTSIWKPLADKAFIIKNNGTEPDGLEDYICDVDQGLNSRFIKEHNICYIYTDNNEIKLSKNLIKNPGYDGDYLDTIKIYPDTYEWDCQTGGDIQFNYYSADTSYGSDIQLTCLDENDHDELELPKLNVNGYRPTIVISNIFLKGKSSEADSKGLTLYFKPWGSRFKSQSKLEDNVDNNDLNIKILDIDGGNVVDITNKYIPSTDGLADIFISPTHGNYYGVINSVDPDDEPELKDYCYIRIEKRMELGLESPSQFLNRIDGGKIKILFNVNDSRIPLEAIAEEIYKVKYKNYEPSFDNYGCGGPTDWLYYLFTSYGFEFILGDFAISGIPPLVEDGKSLARVNIQNKNINGVCINIDCTDIHEMCSGLEGC